MKTIQRDSVVDYHAINVNDAILMLPVMDGLVKDLQDTAEAYHEHEDKPEDQIFFKKEYIKSVERLNLMYSLGFRASTQYQIDESICPFEEQWA